MGHHRLFDLTPIGASLETSENIGNPAQSGTSTTQSEAKSVDSNDEIGCVAVWLEVWLTPA
jgi:hypothetical protein